jgi:hypothetical protein
MVILWLMMVNNNNNLVGGIPTPLKKIEFVSWDDYSQYIYMGEKCSKPPTRYDMKICSVQKLWERPKSMLIILPYFTYVSRPILRAVAVYHGVASVPHFETLQLLPVPSIRESEDIFWLGVP